MSPEVLTRRLSAILSADVEGYSRLMREDEEATVRTITTHRAAMTHMIEQYRGRVVDSPGDNILAEFTSVVDAVNCGVEIQRELAERNEKLPENRRMRFRIGINLGDVLEEGDRIYGDGVNIAARMESLAEAGGICISGTVYDAVESKIGLKYEYLGEHEVKNIDKPIRAYKVLSFPDAAAHRVVKAKRVFGKTWRNALIGIAAILVIAAALGIWNFHFRPPPIEPASVKKMAFPLPNKPSIAVLPFVNMSEDPKQEYFSDGLTDQIISTLSKLRNLFVIARNSVFTYKGKPVKIQKVAEDLGVRYVLEGGVQRTADRIRIIAQLIDATTGHHVWSERYDRELKDIFEIQDDITMEITKALLIELIAGEQARLWERHRRTNLKAYEKVLEGTNYLYRSTKEDNSRARQLFEEAIALDSGFAGAYVGLGWTHFWDARFGWSTSPAESAKIAFKYAEKALQFDGSTDGPHCLLSALYLVKRQYEKAVAEAEHALKFNPNGAIVHNTLAGVLGCSGRWEESVIYGKKSIRLDPFPPAMSFHWLGRAYFMTRRYEEAISTFKKAVASYPNYLSAYAFLAASYSSVGRETEAAASTEEVLRLNPKFCLESYAKTLPYKNESDIDRYLAALRKAGLPETPPLPLPDKPSIAVLPFVNMSGDPEQEYFSDGISEEIITALSKIRHLFVIARTSSFKYKNKDVDVRTVGRELGVRYVLEGSIRIVDNRIRITAQLIDAKTDRHIWAERYDRDLKDIFAIQDDITKRIITALTVRLTDGEQARMWSRKAKNLDVYLKMLEAISLFRKGTKESLIRYGQLGQEIVDMEPDSAIGYRILAWYYWSSSIDSKSPREDFAKAFKLAQKAVSLDHSDPLSYALLGTMYVTMRQYEKAIEAGERSIALDPNGAMVHGLFGRTLKLTGRPDEAIFQLKYAIRLNPFPPYWYFVHLTGCYVLKGQYEEALVESQKALKLAPDNISSLLGITVTNSLLGREKEARAAAKKVLEINPKFSVRRVSKMSPYKDEADIKRIVEAMRNAGLPE